MRLDITSEDVSEIIDGLKQAIKLVYCEIYSSNEKNMYIDEESTSADAVGKDARSKKELKTIINSLDKAIEILDKKDISNNTIDFKENDNEDVDDLLNRISSGTDVCTIVANLKKAISIINTRTKGCKDDIIPSNSPENDSNDDTAVSALLESTNREYSTTDTVEALKQAILLLDKNKKDKKTDVSNEIINFEKNKATTRDMALESVLSGTSLSNNIAALKRAIELSDDKDISTKKILFDDDTSATLEEALTKIKSGSMLNSDIAALKRSIQLISKNEFNSLDISTKDVKWDLTVTDNILDAISNIKSGEKLEVLMPYIKMVLSQLYEKVNKLENEQDTIKVKLGEMTKKIESLNV